MDNKDILMAAIVIIISTSGWVSLAHQDGDHPIGPAEEHQDEISIVTLFCPRDDCAGAIVELMDESDRVRCAFYDLNHPKILDAIKDNSADIVIDSDNSAEIGSRDIPHTVDSGSGYMHNKFCIFGDGTVMTGSMNPTVNGITRNNNNMVIISSELLAENFIHKFNQMFKERRFKDHDAMNRPYQRIVDGEDRWVETYFCPEDDCEDQVIRHIEGAEESIHFMTFSFTSQGIADTITNSMGDMEVKGIFENWLAGSRWSQYHTLNNTCSECFVRSRHDGNMHHKVFIIDGKTTITGSYNPSRNANTNNDENIIIVHDNYTAKRFIEEFNMIWDEYGIED